MAVTIAEIQKLRKLTGAGMMDCKKALEASEGDTQKAIEIIREKGQAVAAKRSDREASEGCVLVKYADGFAAIIALKCETDFVANNADFVKLTQDIIDAAVAAKAKTLDEVKALTIGNETVESAIVARSGITVEKTELDGYTYIEGDNISTYDHMGRHTLCTMVQLNKNNEDAAHKLAMQVAAMNPQYVSRNDISDEELAKMHDITLESALNDPFTLPKPILNALLDKAVDGVWNAEDVAILEEKRNDKSFNFNYLPNFLSEDAKAKLAQLAVADKASISENKIFTGLVQGRVSKQLKEICLLDQTYVRAEDGKQTVAQYLGTVNKDLSLVKVVRFEVGEGIEKKEEDFAAEVAAQQAAAAKK